MAAVSSPFTVLNYTFHAYSVAGFHTNICLPALNIAFDLGICFPHTINQQYVFITHSHLDHLAGLPQHLAIRTLQRRHPPAYVIHPKKEQELTALIQCLERLDENNLPCKIVGLTAPGQFTINNEYTIEPFITNHVIPSQGYILWRMKKKLQPKYLEKVRQGHMDGAELKRLREKNIEVQELKCTPEVVITGDTVLDPLLENPSVMNAKILFLETTILDERISIHGTRKWGHIHLDELIEKHQTFKNKAIILMHVSNRYKPSSIKDIVQQKLPKEFKKRAYVLIHGECYPLA